MNKFEPLEGRLSLFLVMGEMHLLVDQRCYSDGRNMEQLDLEGTHGTPMDNQTRSERTRTSLIGATSQIGDRRQVEAQRPHSPQRHGQMEKGFVRGGLILSSK